MSELDKLKAKVAAGKRDNGILLVEKNKYKALYEKGGGTNNGGDNSVLQAENTELKAQVVAVQALARCFVANEASPSNFGGHRRYY